MYVFVLLFWMIVIRLCLVFSHKILFMRYKAADIGVAIYVKHENQH